MPTTSSSSADVFHRLKADTARIHEQVEQKLQIFSPQFDEAAYKRLLTQFYGFWAPLENELCKVTELQDPALALESRLKAHLLEADLRFFGIDPTDVPVCSALPAVGTPFSALGCMYVLEGSTLGSRLIARHISARFDFRYGSGGSFFNAYEAAVGERWLAFRTFVSSQTGTTALQQELLGAARDTFQCLNGWLKPLVPGGAASS
jgi:heme oxygenase